MTRKKKTIIIASSLLAILCVWTLCVYLLTYGIRTNVTHTKFMLNDCDYFLMTNEGYEFDTGTNILTFNNGKKAENSHRIGWALTWDANRWYHRLNFLRYGKKIQIGKELYISDFTYITTKETVNSRTFPFIKGIVGMNVIQKSNWFFDLKTHQAESFPLDSIVPIPTDTVALSYHGCLVPLTDLDVNGHRIKNVLLDTGFNQDLQLDDATLIEKFGEVVKQDTGECITFDEKRMVVDYTLKDVNINSKSYRNVILSFGNSRLLGLGFMRRFDYIFWDSKHKKVYLWNDKSSENK